MHILVVEDEPRLATMIAQALNEEGHVAEIAGDGEEGYDLAGGGAYDVIILDLMLPKMPGLEVARALRTEKVDTPRKCLISDPSREKRLLPSRSRPVDLIFLPTPQSAGRAEVQYSHSPQLSRQRGMTLSPGRTEVTPEPTSTTGPAPS